LTPEGDGVFGGSTPISPTQAVELLGENYYINVHTDSHQGGEIRGQITHQTPPTHFSALLTGANERPEPVETEAVGIAYFTRVNTDTLEYRIAVSNVVSITAAHIHVGPPNGAGSPVHFLYTGTVPFDPEHPLTGTVTLDAQGAVDLLTGYYYVNLHTQDHPGGELRGQIGGAHLFGAQLDGNQETPAVDTLGFGMGVLGLSADAAHLQYRVKVDGLTDILAAHIHRAPRGQPGGVEFPLPSFSPSGVISGSLPVSDVHLLRLISGDYYINVHTNDHQPGEIRGQVEPMASPGHFSALMTSAEQGGAAANAGAAGFVRFTFHPVINVMNYYMAVTNTTSLIVGAHVHKGLPGVNNPAPTFPLYSAGGNFAPGQPTSGAFMLDAEHFVDLLTGYYYVNVHTQNNPPGEMRGQMGGAHLFGASLDGVQETPARTTDGFGMAILGLSDDAADLSYRVSVNGLPTILNAHIHRAPPGQPGPVDVDVKMGAPFSESQPVSGTVALSDDQVLRLVSGRYYVNVHTVTYPPGEIRGQVRRLAPPARWNALLSGANEVPPVESKAAGIARLALEPLTNLVHYHIAVTNTTAISLAHIHKAPAGVNGKVVVDLYHVNSGQPFNNDTPLIGNARLGSQALVDMLTGYYYINIHTASHGSGELRGQIGGSRLYHAMLNGANEAPQPVTTDATGQAVLALSPDGQQLSYRVMVQEIDQITLAHIHRGEAGQAGPPVFTLYAGSGPFDPANPISGAVELSTGDLQNLAAGKFYINVHTQDHTGGEIRGQIEPFHPNGNFQTLMTEGQEVAPSAIHAAGIARFQLTVSPAVLQYRLDVTGVSTVTAAHIHKGLPGKNGPPVFTLFPAPGGLGVGQPTSGMLILTPPQLVDLLTGYYYVNVHTQDAQSGKVRGQIHVNGAVFEVHLPLVAR
jgi:hypothetical protein